MSSAKVSAHKGLSRQTFPGGQGDLSAQAASIPNGTRKVCLDNPLCADTFAELIDAIINLLFYLAIAITPIMLIMAGFYYLTAAGEPEKINTAKKIILYTLIGLVIVISAKGIMELFQGIFLRQSP